MNPPADQIVRHIDVNLLRKLEPVGSMSEACLRELAELCYIESVNEGSYAFTVRGIAGQSVYLISGKLELVLGNGRIVSINHSADALRRPLGKGTYRFIRARALTPVQLVRIDDDLLDIMATWDQLTSLKSRKLENLNQNETFASENGPMLSGMFKMSNVRYGAFSRLPAAHIEELLRRFQRFKVHPGEVVIEEGAEGDYYYVIESGKCLVVRMVGGASMLLAELKRGDSFGEEALVSNARRNATITTKTNGVLLRLDKKDFVELLREPLLQRISSEDARQKIENGGQWLDVRYPSEFVYDKLPGATNFPLAEIRSAFGSLDMEKEYVVYCQSERRSSAAAFLLAQQGYKAYLLKGGLWSVQGRG